MDKQVKWAVHYKCTLWCYPNDDDKKINCLEQKGIRDVVREPLLLPTTAIYFFKYIFSSHYSLDNTFIFCFYIQWSNT